MGMDFKLGHGKLFEAMVGENEVEQTFAFRFVAKRHFQPDFVALQVIHGDVFTFGSIKVVNCQAQPFLKGLLLAERLISFFSQASVEVVLATLYGAIGQYLPFTEMAPLVNLVCDGRFAVKALAALFER